MRMATKTIGIILNGATGRICSTQHLKNALAAIRDEVTSVRERAKTELPAEPKKKDKVTMVELKGSEPKGFEPKGIIRNSNAARCVALPNMERQRCVEGVTLKDFETIPILQARLQGFRWQYGQPPEVRRAFEQAIGIRAQEPA